MPSPVFCGKGPTAGHTGPAPTRPMMDFRRAACPHAAAKDGQCRPPYELPFSFKSTERPKNGTLGAFGF